MGRKPCCEKIGLKRGPWTFEEDNKLMNFILNNGIHCWRLVPKLAGLKRCGKSCRLRWINYLRPDLKRGTFSEMEEDQIIQLHSRLGNRWAKIATHFPGRTDNEIKNHWNTRIKKRLKVLGIDPLTHKPIEHLEKCDMEPEQISGCSSLWEQEKPFEVELLNKNGGEDISVSQKKQEDLLLDSDETANLLDGVEMLWEDFNVGLMMNPKTSLSNSYSPSFSMEDSFNRSMGESSTLQEDPQQCWVNSTVDSILSWHGFHPVQEDIISLENHQ